MQFQHAHPPQKECRDNTESPAGCQCRSYCGVAQRHGNFTRFRHFPALKDRRLTQPEPQFWLHLGTSPVDRLGAMDSSSHSALTSAHMTRRCHDYDQSGAQLNNEWTHDRETVRDGAIQQCRSTTTKNKTRSMTRNAPGRGLSPGCRGRTGACLWRPGTASSFPGAQAPPASAPAAALSKRPVVLAGYAAPGPSRSPAG